MKHNGNPPREVQQLIDGGYVQHKPECDAAAWHQRNKFHTPNYACPPCTCGLSALLTAAGSSAPSDARLFVEEIGEGRITVGGRIWIPLEVAEARKRP
jgi:hypothetical protein